MHWRPHDGPCATELDGPCLLDWLGSSSMPMATCRNYRSILQHRVLTISVSPTVVRRVLHNGSQALSRVRQLVLTVTPATSGLLEECLPPLLAHTFNIRHLVVQANGCGLMDDSTLFRALGFDFNRYPLECITIAASGNNIKSCVDLCRFLRGLPPTVVALSLGLDANPCGLQEVASIIDTVCTLSSLRTLHLALGWKYPTSAGHDEVGHLRLSEELPPEFLNATQRLQELPTLNLLDLTLGHYPPFNLAWSSSSSSVSPPTLALSSTLVALCLNVCHSPWDWQLLGNGLNGSSCLRRLKVELPDAMQPVTHTCVCVCVCGTPFRGEPHPAAVSGRSWGNLRSHSPEPWKPWNW